MTTTVARPQGEDSAQMYRCQAKICAGLCRTSGLGQRPLKFDPLGAQETAQVESQAPGVERHTMFEVRHSKRDMHVHRRLTSFRLPRCWQHELRLDD
jgi:hypothetical protein